MLDKATGKTRFEVPETKVNGALQRPTLHARADQGTLGWPFLEWIYQAQGIRGSLHNDDCHRQWNNSRNAIRDAGLETALIEGIAAMSCHQGPWHGNSFFCITRDAGKWYFSSRCHLPSFPHFVPRAYQGTWIGQWGSGK